MERRVEYPSVLDPFLALVGRHAYGEELGQRWELDLLDVPKLVGHHLPDQVRISDAHLGNRTEPGDALLAVLLDGAVEERQDVCTDVVAAQRQRLRPRLLVLPAVVAHVAEEETV